MNDRHEGKRFPRTNGLSEPFWAGCREHRLLIQQCIDCGHRQFYPRRLCTSCSGTELEWVPASGRGTVATFTVIRYPVSKAYAEEVPYAIALVRLDEGPTMMSSLIECDPETLESGTAVEVAFEQWSEEITMPRFRPVK